MLTSGRLLVANAVQEHVHRAELRNVLRSRAMVRFARLAVRSCSHILITVQPLARNVRVTSRSRRRFAESFLNQKSAFPFGQGECLGFGHPCQKQPSTNTATRSRRKIKSGLPKIIAWRLHPKIPWRRSSVASASSVSLLPRLRIRDITSDLFVTVKTSVIGFTTSDELAGDRRFALCSADGSLPVHASSTSDGRTEGGRLRTPRYRR